MSFSVAPLLLHLDGVPEDARNALKAAYASPPEERQELFETAARILHRDTELDREDARELVGLPSLDRE